MVSQQDIYTLARKEGLSKGNAKIAAAVAMAESGGNPAAHNTTPPDNSYGLWQINMIGGLGPARLKQFGLSSNDQLFNPETNAKAMKAVSQTGRSFDAWSTYKDGAYHKFIGVNVTAGEKNVNSASWLASLLKDAALAAIPGGALLGPVGGAIGGTKDALDRIADGLGESVHAIDATAGWVSNAHNWVRVGFVIGGGLILVVGLFRILDSTSAGQAANKAALTVAGTAAKVAI